MEYYDRTKLGIRKSVLRYKMAWHFMEGYIKALYALIITMLNVGIPEKSDAICKTWWGYVLTVLRYFILVGNYS